MKRWQIGLFVGASIATILTMILLALCTLAVFYKVFLSQVEEPKRNSDAHGTTGKPVSARYRLMCVRGLKIDVEYPVYDGENYIGRADELAVDIDLDDQEPPDRISSSRQHAKVTCEQDKLLIEDLNSLNRTYVNRQRVPPGSKKQLQVNDIIQIGTVQLKVVDPAKAETR